VAVLVNKVMHSGKKSVARGLIYGAMDIIAERTGKDPLDTFDQAIRNASPVIEVKPRRVGGATYQVPMEVEPDRRLSLAIVGSWRRREAGLGRPLPRSWRMSSSMRPRIPERPLSDAKIRIVWLMPIRLLHITVGK